MKEKEQVEMETVTIKLPKNLMNFLRDMQKNVGMTIQEYLEYAIIQSVGADLDVLDVFIPDPCETTKQYVRRYGLKKILKDTILTPSLC